MRPMDDIQELTICDARESADIQRPAAPIGRIIRSGPGNYLVKVGERMWHCRPKGKLRAAMEKEANLIIVGDHVAVSRMDVEPSIVAGANVAGTAVIDRVLPRTSSLTRRSTIPSGAPLPQVLAANVDLVVIVVSAVSPPLKMGTIERYLLLARQAGIEPLVCINKIDQVGPGFLQEPQNGTGRTESWAYQKRPGCTDQDQDNLKRVLASLEALGVPWIMASAQLGLGVEALHLRLEKHTSVMVGPSGAGKTSLLKCIVPGLESKTLSIGAKTNKGRHSTTWSSLVDIGNGYVADLPGLRAIGFWQLDEDTVLEEYQDIHELAASCRFRNCTHTHEPGCAVKLAIARGQLDEARYRRYLRIMSEASGPRTR